MYQLPTNQPLPTYCCGRRERHYTPPSKSKSKFQKIILWTVGFGIWAARRASHFVPFRLSFLQHCWCAFIAVVVPCVVVAAVVVVCLWCRPHYVTLLLFNWGESSGCLYFACGRGAWMVERYMPAKCYGRRAEWVPALYIYTEWIERVCQWIGLECVCAPAVVGMCVCKRGREQWSNAPLLVRYERPAWTQAKQQEPSNY